MTIFFCDNLMASPGPHLNPLLLPLQLKTTPAQLKTTAAHHHCNLHCFAISSLSFLDCLLMHVQMPTLLQQRW